MPLPAPLPAPQTATPPVAAQDSAAMTTAVQDSGAATATYAPQGSKAADEVPRAAREVIDNVLSPYCPGLLLANCPSPQADSLRKAIVDRARGGETREAIEADLLSWYGEAVRAAPKGEGLGVAAWVTPGVALVTAGVAIALWLRRRTSVAPVPTAAGVASVRPAAAPVSDDVQARLDALVRNDAIDDDEDDLPRPAR
jgi:cytochrome c-type biogenesis protein CcmH/NrfF